MEPEAVTFQLLREITDGFSEERKIGEGAFGVVYKGTTENGEDVAVKLLKLRDSNLDLNIKQFKNEFNNLMMLKHQNIVQVLGYCYETEQVPIEHNGTEVLAETTHGALCLEYLHNGSLQNHISDEFHGLDWPTRYKIIKGACEGLKYIHEETLCHLDLKPDNILLDKSMTPKIADFGLSRIFGKETTQMNTQSRLGTPGYQPPEHIERGEISEKFDIFSLGVIVTKIVSGPEGDSKCQIMSSNEFIDLVKINWRNRLQKTCSGSLLETYCRQVQTCTQISLNCMEYDSKKRHDIVKIINSLNETETHIREVSQKRCRQTVRGSTERNKKKKKMRNEPNEITYQHRESFGVGHIVGRTEEKNKIMTYLLESATQNELAILPIYGIGGIGKTTFARLIYSDSNFRSYSHVWVDVSLRFDLTKIQNSIVSQLSEKQSQTNERQMMNSCVMKPLSHKKILIVLDDLWEDNPFKIQDLKDMLYHDGSNTIVLVTTRSELVAEKICTAFKPHQIEYLTNDMCWDIIKQRSYFEARDDKEYLIETGEQIALKCGGVALAAQSLGFMLKSMTSDQWKEVKDSDIWNESISQDASSPNHVLASLKLSYCSMPQNLGSCFAYCAIFPKGHEIVKHELVHQWRSLGFIMPTKMQSTMQVSEDYIVQLLGLSFLQHTMSSLTSGVFHEDVRFTMHHLVHDLARSILAEKLLDTSKENHIGGIRCRYALLTDCTKPLELSTTSADGLMALRFHECGRTVSCSAFSSAISLRILDLSECSIQMLPDSICQLKELRYLDAPRIQYRLIPDCITKLSKLNYLDIRGSSEILALPESIGEMEGLTYLDLTGCFKMRQLPASFENLKNLERLNFTCCSNVTGISELIGGLVKLKYLNLSYCENIGKLPNSLGRLTKLQYLNLSYSSYLDIDEADVLGSLTKLKYLNLSSEGSSLKRLPDTFGSITELKYLNLSGCEDLRALPKSFAKLLNLVHLDLSRCFGVEGAPQALRGLTKLQHLNLSCCSENLRGLEHVMGSLTELCDLNLQGCLETMFGDQQVEDINSFLRLISTLSKLEHLNLSLNGNLYSVPESLVELRKLQTLDLSYCLNLQRLPEGIAQISCLKFLNTMNCEKLDKSMTPQFNNNSIIFPHYVVRAGAGESSSTLVLLEHENPTTLEISRLENVKSVEEAQRIELIEKYMLDDLTFMWTRDAKRFVPDREVLTELMPPDSLGRLKLQGYNSVCFPYWVMDIAVYLPYLVKIFLKDLPRCHTLPPLGQLPNLKWLRIERMDSIWKIGGDMCGGVGAFRQLEYFCLADMKNLEEWNTIYSSTKNAANMLMFPSINCLHIDNCPKLRMKPCLPPRVKYRLFIRSSDTVMSSLEERGKVTDYKCAVTGLAVQSCEMPLHQWRLLHHLPCLTSLTIRNCNDLTCSSNDILGVLTSLDTLDVQDCETVAALPDWLGDLVSLEILCISNCRSLKTLPDSIQQLTNMLILHISRCPDLVQWCKSEESYMKHAHIDEIELDGEVLERDQE